MINSSPTSAAYMRRWTGSALVQKMACRIFGAEPLSEPMLGFCQLDTKEQNFSFTKMHVKISSAKWGQFVQGGWVKSSNISWFWDYAEINPKPWDTRNCLSCIPSSMTTETQGPDSV